MADYNIVISHKSIFFRLMADNTDIIQP